MITLKTGTRNVGGMNVVSSIGRIPGIIVIAVDIMKGFLAASLADRFSGGHPFIPLWAVVAAAVDISPIIKKLFRPFFKEV